ncbi:MAG: hypothetical protein ACLQIH_13055 [Myxococcaceae bacterium]
MRHLSKLILACALSIGCATAVPQAKIDGTQKAIASASDAVGSQGGAAADRLADAKKEFDSAMEMAKAGKTDEASRMLAKAEADAKLAGALANEATTRSQLQAVTDQIQTLKTQLGK